jgi:anthranilate synthase component 2
MRVLIIDNYDSFTYNLVQYFGELGVDPVVARNDQLTLAEAAALEPDRLVISPGPGIPQDAGRSVEFVRRLGPEIPTLGVCLGHQAVIVAFGGEIGPAPRPRHGKTSAISHDGKGVLRGLPDRFTATRYHSLAATEVPPVLEVTATSEDGVVQGVRHTEFAIEGVQFHPESIMTGVGKDLLANFVGVAE